MNNQTKKTQIIFNAYNSLTETEFKLLGRAASRWICGTTFSEPDDLLHEALVRTLDGRRNYPSQVSFGLYMNLAMRSIADGDRDLRGNVDPGPDLGEQEADDRGESADENQLAPSAEDECAEMETLKQIATAVGDIRDSLGDDEVACAVLDGIVFEELPEETRKARGIGPKAFDAARKRLERRLNPLRDVFLSRNGTPERSRTRRAPLLPAATTSCSTRPAASRASRPDASRADVSKHAPQKGDATPSAAAAKRKEKAKD